MSAPPRHPTPHALAAALPLRLPDARLRYGEASPAQFGDLRLPRAAPPPRGFPVAVFVHGGAWSAEWTKDYCAPFVEALTATGLAAWDLEFRRLGHRGGGYPETFRDIALGADHLRELAQAYPLDLARVLAIGHSSGGHLALWLAGRRRLDPASALYAPDPLRLRGAISLGGVNDLELSLELGRRADILTLLGAATAEEAAPRFLEASPRRLLPLGVPQALVTGAREDPWRLDMTRAYAEAARDAGDEVRLTVAEDLDHFDLIDAEGPALEIAAREAAALLG